MLIKKPTPETGLDKAIDKVLLEMQKYSANDDEYANMVKQLGKLHTMKVEETRPRVSPDTLITVAANLVGILIIVAHEQTHVLTSKALNFVMKLR